MPILICEECGWPVPSNFDGTNCPHCGGLLIEKEAAGSSMRPKHKRRSKKRSRPNEVLYKR
jgi:hypothetical protein